MAAKELYDYLSEATSDNDETLTVSPSDVIVDEGEKLVSIHMGDDGSEERISFSDTPIIYVTLIWRNRLASDAGTIMDFYYSTSKGNGRAESFYWDHPVDGHTYVVRFESKLKMETRQGPNYLYTYPSVTFRVLGYKAKKVVMAFATGGVAINETINPACAFQLEHVKLHLSAAGGAGSLTVTVDAVQGAAYDVVLKTQDMTSVTDLVWSPERPLSFRNGDQLKVAWANANTCTYGLEVGWREL